MQKDGLYCGIYVSMYAYQLITRLNFPNSNIDWNHLHVLRIALFHKTSIATLTLNENWISKPIHSLSNLNE